MATSLPVFARRFAQARQLSGLSQKAVGVAAGIDPFVASPRINQYERGVHAPDYTTARKLAKVLGVTTAFLYADDDEVARLLLAVSALTPRGLRRFARLIEDGG